MELTDEQFDRLCKAHKSWIKNEGYLKRDCLEDDEYFIHRDLPDIWEKFRAEIAERAPKIWDEGIIPYLPEMDLYIPDEAYEENCPDEEIIISEEGLLDSTE